MDKLYVSSKLSGYSRDEAEQRANSILSDFQRQYFAKYYANPFPLRKSSVLVLLFVRDCRLKTLMIERTDVGVHAGQVSFPGGKSEPTDCDTICTALRETVEEIGIEVLRSDVVGDLPSVKVPVSKFEIFPVVAFVDDIGEFVRSENEVKRVIEVDLAELQASFSIRSITVAGKNYEVPSYICGDSVVWGATAMIVAELFSVIGEI